MYLIDPAMPRTQRTHAPAALPTALLHALHRVSAAGQLARLHPSHPAHVQLARPYIARRAACGGGAGAATALLGVDAGMVRVARDVATDARRPDTPLAAPRGGLSEANSQRGNSKSGGQPLCRAGRTLQPRQAPRVGASINKQLLQAGPCSIAWSCASSRSRRQCPSGTSTDDMPPRLCNKDSE